MIMEGKKLGPLATDEGQVTSIAIQGLALPSCDLRKLRLNGTGIWDLILSRTFPPSERVALPAPHGTLHVDELHIDAITRDAKVAFD